MTFLPYLKWKIPHLDINPYFLKYTRDKQDYKITKVGLRFNLTDLDKEKIDEIPYLLNTYHDKGTETCFLLLYSSEKNKLMKELEATKPLIQNVYHQILEICSGSVFETVLLSVAGTCQSKDHFFVHFVDIDLDKRDKEEYLPDWYECGWYIGMGSTNFSKLNQQINFLRKIGIEGEGKHIVIEYNAQTQFVDYKKEKIRWNFDKIGIYFEDCKWNSQDIKRMVNYCDTKKRKPIRLTLGPQWKGKEISDLVSDFGTCHVRVVIESEHITVKMAKKLIQRHKHAHFQVSTEFGYWSLQNVAETFLQKIEQRCYHISEPHDIYMRSISNVTKEIKEDLKSSSFRFVWPDQRATVNDLTTILSYTKKAHIDKRWIAVSVKK